MKKPQILKVREDLSIPWFKQIQKTVFYSDDVELQTFYSIKPPDYVTALTHTTEDKFVILKQYRPAVEDYTFELPSGHLEEGETPFQAMMRELREETGSSDGEAILMGEIIPDTGRLENRLWAFYAHNVIIKSLPVPHENEGIEVHLVSYEKLFEMINTGEINHALDLSVISLAIIGKHLKL
jgi:8-oxo-dGTP pyrophosphatase MutT (NUDIX family)